MHLSLPLRLYRGGGRTRWGKPGAFAGKLGRRALLWPPPLNAGHDAIQALEFSLPIWHSGTRAARLTVVGENSAWRAARAQTRVGSKSKPVGPCAITYRRRVPCLGDLFWPIRPSGLFGRLFWPIGHLYHFPSVLWSVLTGAERSVKKKSAQCLGQETPLELDGHLVQITTAGGHRIVEAVADSIFRTSTRQLPT